MPQQARQILLWVLAAGGAAVYLWYIVTAGQATLANPTAAPDIKPAELVGFGTLVGTLLATNLGTVLGIAIKPGEGLIKRLNENSVSPWAQSIGAIFYVICLAVAIWFYKESGWSATAAEVLRSALATLLGVAVGAATAVLGAK